MTKVTLTVAATLAAAGAALFASAPATAIGVANQNCPTINAAMSDSSPPSAREREAALVADYLDRGWTLTPLGKQIAAGGPLPSETAPAVADGSMGQAILAVLPKTAGPRTLGFRTPHDAARTSGAGYVILNCGFGVIGNVNYQHGYGFAHVEWGEFNVYGTGRTIVGPTTFCPTANKLCLTYAWRDPPSSWEIFDAHIYASIGPYSEWGYCG